MAVAVGYTLHAQYNLHKLSGSGGWRIFIWINDLAIAHTSNSFGLKESVVTRHHAITILTKRGVFIHGEISSIGILIDRYCIPMTIL